MIWELVSGPKEKSWHTCTLVCVQGRGREGSTSVPRLHQCTSLQRFRNLLKCPPLWGFSSPYLTHVQHHVLRLERTFSGSSISLPWLKGSRFAPAIERRTRVRGYTENSNFLCLLWWEFASTSELKPNNYNYECVTGIWSVIALKGQDAEVLGKWDTQGHCCTAEGNVAMMGLCGSAEAALLCWSVEGDRDWDGRFLKLEASGSRPSVCFSPHCDLGPILSNLCLFSEVKKRSHPQMMR